MSTLTDVALRLRVLHRAWRMRLRADVAQVRAILDHLHPGDVAVDVGSHKGGFSYWMRRAVGPAGAVYAFEPQPESAVYQRRVAHAFGFTNAVVETLALSSHPGEGAFAAIPGGFHPGGRLGTPRPAEGETVSVVETDTLDRYFESARRPVALIKIDAEGHEREILEGGRRLIEQDRPLLIFESERSRQPGRTIRPILGPLLELGYEGRFIQGKRLRDLEEFDEKRHQRGRYPEVNNFVFRPVAQEDERMPGLAGHRGARSSEG